MGHAIPKTIYGDLVYHKSTMHLVGRGRWIMRSGDQDHPGQHGETPSLLKYKIQKKKKAGRDGVCL